MLVINWGLCKLGGCLKFLDWVLLMSENTYFQKERAPSHRWDNIYFSSEQHRGCSMIQSELGYVIKTCLIKGSVEIYWGKGFITHSSTVDCNLHS